MGYAHSGAVESRPSLRDIASGAIRELARRSAALTGLGLVQFALLLVLVVLVVVDDRQITGLNRWIKPAKFAASVGVYAWTLAWYLGYLKDNLTSARVVGRAVAFGMYLEMACVMLQAIRGRASHFNQETAFDGAVFSLMGIFIVVNTLLVIYTLILFCVSRVELPSPYLWGIRLGMLLFIVSGLQGFVMTVHGGHTIGLPDGGPGLPILNWSTAGGDLRVAHFVGLHALQVIPLAGYVLSRRASTPLFSPTGWTAVVALVYLLVVTALFVQAMRGQPLSALINH
jgi:hypothetical protein